MRIDAVRTHWVR